MTYRLSISEPDQSTVRARTKDLSAAVSVMPVHAFALCMVAMATARKELVIFVFMFVPFGFLCLNYIDSVQIQPQERIRRVTKYAQFLFAKQNRAVYNTGRLGA